MADAQVVHQTACLRPVAADGLLVLGRVPGLDSVYVATGGARKGILYGPPWGMPSPISSSTGAPPIALDAFAPGRFGGQGLRRNMPSVRPRAFLPMASSMRSMVGGMSVEVRTSRKARSAGKSL